MLEPILDAVTRFGPWAYLVIFLLMSLESCVLLGMLVPGEATTLFAGFLVSHGSLHLAVLLPLVCAGAVLGNLLGYALGRRLQHPWLLRHGGRLGLRPEHLRRAEEFFHSHGGKTVLIARFSPFLRSLLPFVAGASRQRFGPFLFYTVLGGVIWATALVMLGYLLGESWKLAQGWLGNAGLVILAMLVAAGVFAWLRYRRRRQSR